MIRGADPIDHPSPHRNRISVSWLLAGLAVPPVAWALEMLMSYGISSNACPLTRMPDPKPGFSGEAIVLIVLQLACLVATTASGLMSWRHWQRVRSEKTDSEHSHMTIGDGRSRFMALAGMLTAGMFAVAILFNVLEPMILPLCWSLR